VAAIFSTRDMGCKRCRYDQLIEDVRVVMGTIMFEMRQSGHCIY
jgi:hypothetical protein